MAKKITGTTPEVAPVSTDANLPVEGGSTNGEPGGKTPEPETPRTTGTASAEPDSGEETEPTSRTPDYADRLLEIFDRYPKLYIDRQGSTYTEDTPAPIRADAALYTNPYHKT